MYMQDDVRDSLDTIISSYEDRIKSVESTYDNIFQIFHTFQTFFIDTKQEQEQTNTQLRENLARNGSLRKKDFDNMMQDILKTQDEREEAVKGLLNVYLNEQYKTANILRENLSEVRGALAKGEVEKIREFKGLIRSLLDEQESKKEEITSNLKEFQKEQERVTTGIKDLLAKGNELRIRDFKKMLKEIQLQNRERTERTQERRQEVMGMLADFERQRTETASRCASVASGAVEKRRESSG